MSRKNNTESAAYKRNRICIFYAVGDPAALLFDLFASWGDKRTAGGNLPPTLNCNEIFRILFFLFLAWLREILVVQKKLFIFSDITY